MFLNYLKATVRSLLRQKTYAAINAAGLAVGLAGCLPIFLYVADEMSFDDFHEREASIRRVIVGFPNKDGGVDRWMASRPAGAAPLFPKEFPEIELPSGSPTSREPCGSERRSSMRKSSSPTPASSKFSRSPSSPDIRPRSWPTRSRPSGTNEGATVVL